MDCWIKYFIVDIGLYFQISDCLQIDIETVTSSFALFQELIVDPFFIMISQKSFHYAISLSQKMKSPNQEPLLAIDFTKELSNCLISVPFDEKCKS